MSEVLCLDVGSTWTKAALISGSGELLGTAQHATTPPEVLDGIAEVTTALGADGVAVLACSSAGGGLRLAVVGQERLISAEAGYRVALSAGAKVVHVSAGELDGAGIRALRAARPDVLLLAGGTDGGETRVLLHNARRLAANRVTAPIVLAGNLVAQPAAIQLLAETGRQVVATDNVLPDVGELAPGPARAAIRAVFLTHVIGGKGLSKGPRFRQLVSAVTPDAVLVGVSCLARVLAESDSDGAGAVLVVDVGGATTDVYSAVSAQSAESGPARAVALPPERRTVEGDIGMRWSAPGIVAEAAAERLLADGEHDTLAEAARFRAEHVEFIPADPAEVALERRLAGLAAVLALRRHVRMVDGRFGPRGAGILIASGGVFRHATTETLSIVESMLRADPVLRPVLRHAAIVVDRDYVLAPAGLLTDAGNPVAAENLLRANLLSKG
ncbi:MAG TPA: glutamate mutase L [Pseudonocardiaceae bacterium]|jgi:uncharacterized protein (TIGR01319 family)|nr:glutamate mutase L [Pseudonocardiaceae bacterium]